MTINYARESVIDFTKPFMNLGISILFKVSWLIENSIFLSMYVSRSYTKGLGGDKFIFRKRIELVADVSRLPGMKLE